MVSEYFPPEYVTVVEGGREEVEMLLRERFDYVFFTGSTSVGRAVMQAAARHPIPVTLELGGKSPCIVCSDVNVETAARRIMWGKCLNAGQTCVAPDFVLVDERIKDSLLQALERALRRFFGESVQSSKDFGRIVNRKHFERLVSYFPQGRIVYGGEYDERDLFIAPTIMTDVDPGSPLMQEEIFGPILPVLAFGDLGDVISMLRDRPEPLALYLFTKDSRIQNQVVEQTASGGVCINDTVTHILGKDLPFGGVGASGMGAYRGKAGFDCFTHYKSVLRRSMLVDPAFRYPPASVSLATLKRVARFLLGR
jgi:acyl-CoA reductase-like NAD-dependent aldehyde dehydrogenase